ncbi:hypothetical protein CLIM01_10071 [Colletotrichum limetticola]|uniref:Pfs domain-containing protein n=1 Tax=Colletotrichum limetticola TaxID=1209924 RepID=A0ABQ9PKW2_9PEZI|nr:hypothetical protein CLIM01_10071 [Colletotrichum limetticola]
MQFMSQSLGWADNIALAMVPLGIITIIISAIRVGGPGFLKALIGRARENLAVAEQELMSSTSTEVCELWNGHEVVRCMGSAPIAEFICLLPESGVTKETKTQQDHVESPNPVNPSTTGMIITRNPRKSSPNITLNSHNITSRAELRTAALWGILLQLGLVAYAGCSVYHPALGFLKDGNPVARYAFPCHWVGTLLLVVGLLLCAHVVESSTVEESFRPSKDLMAQMVWLQQTKTVSDQIFDSFAVYSKSKRPFITTSEREREARNPSGPSLKQEEVSGSALMNESPKVFLELETTIGMTISLCGYIVQFFGLRGLHWSVSIAQLGAILLMTGVRSWVRRGLANPPTSFRTRSGFELDWFATTFADVPNSPWIPEAKCKAKPWKIGCLKAHVEQFEEGVQKRDSDSSIAHRVVMIRKDIAQLANWQGPASMEAVSLARSIEATMDLLFRDSEQVDYTWSLASQRGEPGENLEEQLIYFRLNRIEGKWNAHADELEAALSMWLYSIDDIEKNEETNHQDTVGDNKDDKWLRVKGSPSRPGLRLLGSYTESLHRDLSWWMPSETTRIIRLSRLTNLPEDGVTNDELCKENHRVVGSGGSEIGRRRYGAAKLSEFTIEIKQPEKYERKSYESGSGSKSEEGVPETPPTTEGDGSNHDFLAAEFLGPLKLLYAQDMFSSFFRTAAMSLKEPLEGPVDTRKKHEATAHTSWKSFVLHNSQLSQLARDIESTGLGSLSDAHLSMIPALSFEKKLPGASIIIDLAREKARIHERLQDWQQAGEIYLWLFRVARTFPLENELSTLATVIVVDFLRQVSLALDLALQQIQTYDDEPPHGLWEVKDLKQELQNELLSNFDMGVEPTVAALLRMYENQRRPWKLNLLKDPVSCNESESGCNETSNSGSEDGSSKTSNSCQEKLNYTDLHEAARIQIQKRYRKQMSLAKDINAKDVLGWTPLHYGVRRHDIVTTLMRSPRIDINARDLVEWTPLHYACKTQEKPDNKIDYEAARLHATVGSMPYNTILRLLEGGADINAQGRDGVAPIHCAAITGFVEGVKLLTEAGAEINVLDGSGKTALHWAVFYGRQATVEYLWRIANRTLRDRKGRTALHLAVISGNWEIATWLADNDAEIVAGDRNRRIPLHQAAWDGKLDLIQLMYKKSPAAVNTPDGYGGTPLRCAVRNGQEVVVRWLLEQTEAEINPTSGGYSLIHSAIEQDRADIAELLIKHGASLASRSGNERSLLHEAVLHGNEEITEMLLKAGARNSFDEYGNSVFKMAKGRKKERVFRSLLEKYDVNVDEEW